MSSSRPSAPERNRRSKVEHGVADAGRAGRFRQADGGLGQQGLAKSGAGRRDAHRVIDRKRLCEQAIDLGTHRLALNVRTQPAHLATRLLAGKALDISRILVDHQLHWHRSDPSTVAASSDSGRLVFIARPVEDGVR